MVAFRVLLVLVVFFSCALAGQSQCDPSGLRTTCGFVGIAEEECEKEEECCWDESVAPYCFAPSDTTSYEMDFSFTGSPTFCSQCAAPGDYACSDKSNWHDGTFAFIDATPAGSVAVSIQFDVLGSFGCDGDQIVDDVGIYLNDFLIDIDDVVPTADVCECNSCDGTISFSTTLKYGLPMVLGGNNTIQIKNYYNEICVATIHMTVTYVKDEYGFEVFTKEATYQSGAYSETISPGLCGSTSGKRMDTTNFQTSRYSFVDPLPKNYFLVAAFFRVYGRFWYDGGSCQDNASMTVSMGKVTPIKLNISQPILTLPENPDVCLKAGCDNGWQFESTALYQNGWTGYVYSGLNSVYLTDEGPGKISVAKVDVILWGYPNPQRK